MKIVDIVGRELSPGDVICLQEVKNHDFTVVAIQDNALTTAPGQPPKVIVQMQCNLFMEFQNMGQAGIALPVYLAVKKSNENGQGQMQAADKELKPHLLRRQ